MFVTIYEGVTYAFLFGSLQEYHIKVRYPMSELACPILQSTLRDDDQMGPFDALVVLEVSQEGYCLQRFSQALTTSISCIPENYW